MKRAVPSTTADVTPEQVRRYERQARQLVDDTLREYETHEAACATGLNPLHDKWHWKALKPLESLHVYKERQPTHPVGSALPGRTSKASSGSTSGHSVSSVAERPTKPTQAVAMAAYTPEMALASSGAAPGSSSIASLVVTGHINGSLNDAMYGVKATDTAELQLRLRYMPDTDMLDTAVISCLQTPSIDNPFRCLGVQWLVRGEPSRVKTSSRHRREFVLLVAVGVVQHKVSATETQEVGYHLCQSVELEECLETFSHGLTRGWISTCSLFVPIKGSSTPLSVFSRGFADFKGKMQDYQATSMLSTWMLAGVTQAATSGQNKKLSWLIHFPEAAQEFRQRQPALQRSSKRCGICERKFGVLTSSAACHLCRLNVCSRCRVSRDLSFVVREDSAASMTQSRTGNDRPDATGQVQCLMTTLCKNCKMNASHMDARVMARREVEAGYGLHITMSTGDGGFSSMEPRTRTSLSYPQSGSEQSYSGDPSTHVRIWTPDTNTVKGRGRERNVKERLANAGPCRNRPDVQLLDIVGPDLSVSSLETRKRTGLEFSTQFEPDSSFASTLPSQRDRDSSLNESCLEVTTYQSRQQHHPQYANDAPEIAYVRHPPASVECTQADLVRRMQLLQLQSESVYQFTSQMNAHTRYRHQQTVHVDSSTSISELD